MEGKFKKLFTLFITFFKIGLFTFGGGYAMIPIIQEEVSQKRKWIKNEEVLEVIAISESTPGPIAINAATYVGYKVGGFLGSLFSTIGLIIPSFIIIFIISLFFEQFKQITIIFNALQGIKAVVAFLVIKGAFSLLKSMKKDTFSIILSSAVFIAMLIISFIPTFSISSVFIILGGALLGLIFQLLEKEK